MCVCLCFGEDTFVTTPDGEKNISDLKPQDKLLTARKSGDSKWTKFYTYLHREDEVEADFFALIFSNGKELKVSGEHLVYIRNKDGRKIAIQANNLKEGDEMYHMDSVTGCITPIQVMDKLIIRQIGIYAPLTFSGHFLANGILVTCYAVVNKFEIAHLALAPLRTWYKVFKKKKKDRSSHGIHAYAEALVKLKNILPQPIIRFAIDDNKV